MNLMEWNKKQIAESQSATNRWYFSQKHPDIKNPSNAQLLRYFIRNGGAEDFRKTNKQDASE